jgi:hypothetical protein
VEQMSWTQRTRPRGNLESALRRSRRGSIPPPPSEPANLLTGQRPLAVIRFFHAQLFELATPCTCHDLSRIVGTASRAAPARGIPSSRKEG